MKFMTRDRGPLPPVILLASILAELGLAEWLLLARLLAPPVSYLGALIILLGIGIAAAPVFAFHRSATTILPFQESTALIDSGMYRISRNPMYLGMLLVLVGVAMLTGALSPYIVPVVFVPLLNRRVIRHEEAMLEERFGDRYMDYKRRVRRWV